MRRRRTRSGSEGKEDDDEMKRRSLAMMEMMVKFIEDESNRQPVKRCTAGMEHRDRYTKEEWSHKAKSPINRRQIRQIGQ
jgi:hypothetical protein